MPSSRESSPPKNWTHVYWVSCVSCIGTWILYHWCHLGSALNMCVLPLQSYLIFVTPWTVTHQALLSLEFSMQKYWSGLSCFPPEDLPYPGIKPESFMSPALGGRFFTTNVTRELYSPPFNKPLWKECEKEYICIYNWITLLYTRNAQTLKK